jgi:hypothetical protein
MGKDSGIVEITPRALTEEECLVIGQIVRVTADFEDCLNLWICKLSDVSEAKSAVILGRSNTAAKLAIALGLASMHGEHALKRHKAAFDGNADSLLSCRNAVAHGVFAGESDDNGLVFVTATNVGYEEAELQRRADVYYLQTLKDVAANGREWVSRLDDHFGLSALRKRRQWQRSPVLPKRQPKGRQGAKPKRQRKASPA